MPFFVMTKKSKCNGGDHCLLNTLILIHSIYEGDGGYVCSSKSNSGIYQAVVVMMVRAGDIMIERRKDPSPS